MIDRLILTRFIPAPSPAFEGEWHGKPVSIRLDSSAMLKLRDTMAPDLPQLPAKAAVRVRGAARRLLEASRAPLQVVTLSALDLD